MHWFDQRPDNEKAMGAVPPLNPPCSQMVNGVSFQSGLSPFRSCLAVQHEQARTYDERSPDYGCPSRQLRKK
jgi:hypothetical protein